MIHLDEQTRKELTQMRKKERNVRRHMKLSVILNLDRGLSPAEVAEFLGIDDSTVYRYAQGYKQSGLEAYLDDNWVAFSGLLSDAQLLRLKEEVSEHLYLCAREVGAWIKEQFGVQYHEKHVVKILRSLGFVYKKTKLVPGKADIAKQQAYIEDFEKLMAEKGPDTVVFFNDGVHPQFNTRSEYAWIQRGQDYQIPSQAGRQRLNITGAMNAEIPTELHAVEQEAVNTQSTLQLWEKIECSHPGQRIIHICDNACYYKSKLIQAWLKDHPRTKVRYLPPYSPNLNPIERVWKLLKKEMINSCCYENLKEFRQYIMGFFEQAHIWKTQLQALITLKFRPMGY